MTPIGIGIGISPVLLGGGGARWDPSQPTGGGVSAEHWYRSDQGLWQDAGVTPAVLDADPVGRWHDLTANADHVNQAVVARKPTLRLAVLNGHPVVRAASGNLLVGAFTNGGALTQPFTVFAVAMLAAAAVDDGVNRAIFDGDDNANRMTLFQRAAGAPDDWGWYGGQALNGGVTDSNWHIWTCRANGALFRVWKNGVSEMAGNGGAHVPDGITIFSARATGGDHPWIGDAAEIIIYDSDLSDADKNQVGRYLATRYGLAYTDIV